MNEIQRRTVLKGAAWAVPVVTVASAAPALAASPTCVPTAADVAIRGVTSCGTEISVLDILYTVTCPCTGVQQVAGWGVNGQLPDGWSVFSSDVSQNLLRLVLHGPQYHEPTDVRVVVNLQARCGAPPAVTNLVIDHTFSMRACPTPV